MNDYEILASIEEIRLYRIKSIGVFMVGDEASGVKIVRDDGSINRDIQLFLDKQAAFAAWKVAVINKIGMLEI